MLTLDDMPTGYSVDPDPADDSSDDDFTSGDPGCKELVDSADVKSNKVDEEEASFTQGDYGPFVAESVTTTKEGKAGDGFADARKALDSCNSYTAGEGDDSVTFKVSRMSFPNLGDETLAYSLSGESSGFPFSGQIVVTRLGDNVILLSAAGVGGSGMKASDFEKIARTASKKVAGEAA
ncbi:hypothetical protein ASD11_14610 [Aeromicrobium sp. Root495]|nr:hypothetical protein ASD11_14610 [Aeromicrobium sp. Root495]